MLGIRLETGMALASFALHAMFVAYLLSLYYALSKTIAVGNVILFPMQLAIVGIFLFALPGFGLAAIAYIMSRRDALRVVSIILIAQGIMMPLGMLYASSVSGGINEEYKTFDILILPQVFMAAGLAPIGLGAHLARLRPAKRKTI